MFAGNYQVVASINSFIPISEVDYHTQIHGLEKESKLSPSLASSLHKFIIQVSMHFLSLVFNASFIAFGN